MDASHILVGGLTAIAIALLVWIEIRCRRNSAAQSEQQSAAIARPGTQPPPTNKPHGH
jgi:hypothetical protein